MLAEARSGRQYGSGSNDGPFARILAILKSCLNQYKIDPPASDEGEWWLDLVIGDFETNVSYKAERGFGVYLSNEESLGSRPDELFTQPDAAARRILQLVEARREQRSSCMRLSDVRRMAETSQVQLAARLRVNQAVISRLESQNDAKLSTILGYIKALGGHAELVVRFDAFEAPIKLFGDPSPSVGTRGKFKLPRSFKVAA